jgi:hypothetical protein
MLNSRYSIGNILGVVLAMVVCAAMACYAVFGEPTGRIGRNWQFVAVFGVLGVLWTGWILIHAIRSRR